MTILVLNHPGWWSKTAWLLPLMAPGSNVCVGLNGGCDAPFYGDKTMSHWVKPRPHVFFLTGAKRREWGNDPTITLNNHPSDPQQPIHSLLSTSKFSPKICNVSIRSNVITAFAPAQAAGLWPISDPQMACASSAENMFWDVIGMTSTEIWHLWNNQCITTPYIAGGFQHPM